MPSPATERLAYWHVLYHELLFAVVFVPVSLAPVGVMALVLGLDASQPRERTALLVGALASLMAVFLVYRLYQRRMLETQLREALAEQARTDVLTGLGNRRRLYEDLDLCLARAAREERPISLLLVDLDRFKQINDQLGHATGDEILVSFARAARRATRKGSDQAYRMGGDEFTVVLGDADRHQAAIIARRLRQAYREESRAASGDLQPDCSIGVATRDSPDSDETVDAWLSRADQAMYVAKRSGGGVALAAVVRPSSPPVEQRPDPLDENTIDMERPELSQDRIPVVSATAS